MGKKDKQKPSQTKTAPPLPKEPLLSRRGKIVLGAGILLAAVGFYLLTLTDPAGRNWASNLCPFVILGGYALMGVGIVLPDRDEDKPA